MNAIVHTALVLDAHRAAELARDNELIRTQRQRCRAGGRARRAFRRHSGGTR